MTAAHALPKQGPAAPGRHRAETASQPRKAPAAKKPPIKGLPTNAKAKATPRKAVLREVPVSTGKARFSVNSAGEASKNLLVRTATGYGTVAAKAGMVLADACEPDIFSALFATPKQRNRRYNAQAIARVLLLTASAASKIAARRRK